MLEFFSPVKREICKDESVYQPTQLGNRIAIYSEDKGFPDWTEANIAIIGVEEDRRCINNKGCALGTDYVRQKLYQLYQGDYLLQVVDLGNIKQGFNVEDTYFALSSVVAQLIKKKITPVIIGGGQDLSYANYCAYEKLEQTINIVAVDPKFDLGDVDQDLNSQSYLSKIILHQPNYLFNYSNIGYQTYFVEQASIELMNKLHFDSYRLGQVQASIEEVEPIVRNADMVTFDISAIRQSDAFANGNAGPNGFYGEEACQIARYAGLSDKLSSIGFYEYNPAFDKESHTAHLLAQMVWCFIDGYYNRKKDYPFVDKGQYTKYTVAIQENKHEIIFYKSNKSDRWWMEVPYPVNKRLRYERHHLLPCSYADYEVACKDELPNRWWQAYQKLT